MQELSGGGAADGYATGRRPGTVGELGEFGLIRELTSRLTATPAVRVGPGDDAAVVSAPDRRVVATTDVLLEGRHFRRDWSTAYDVGRKGAAQNLADIAAMGAAPTALLLALVVPAELPANWPTELMDGIRDEAAVASAAVVGGDVARGETITVSITALGDLRNRQPVTRGGALPGDVVAVTGWLGWSAAGHAVLSRGFRSPRAFVEAPPVERVHVHDCTFEAGLGAIVFGTNATTVRDIRVENCDCSGDQPLVRFKLRPDTPGQLYERIRVKGVRLRKRPQGIWHGGEIFYGAPSPLGPDQGDGPVEGLIVTVEPDHGIDVPPSPPAHVIRDLAIDDVTGTTRGFGDLRTTKHIKVSNVTLRRIDVTVTDRDRAALLAKGVRSIRVSDVRVNGQPLSVIR